MQMHLKAFDRSAKTSAQTQRPEAHCEQSVSQTQKSIRGRVMMLYLGDRERQLEVVRAHH